MEEVGPTSMEVNEFFIYKDLECFLLKKAYFVCMRIDKYCVIAF